MKLKHTYQYYFTVAGKALLLLLLLSFSACKKALDVDSPSTNVTGDNVYKNDATAIAVMTGVYIQMSDNYSLSSGISSLSYYPGLSSDELTLYNGVIGAPLFYYKNALSNKNTEGVDFWVKIYPLIYICNSAINGVSASNSLTPAVKQQLLGEAKFVRAFCYFNLIQLYGDVPLALGTDYTINNQLPRTDKTIVYKQVIQDLQEAQSQLNENFTDATLLETTDERVRPTKGAATALLARVYLYTGDYTNAAAQATAVISNDLYTLSPLTGPSSVFMKNSSESIWQLQPVISAENTPDGWLFNIPSSGPSSSYPVSLSKFMLAAFEPGDQRRVNWVNDVTVDNMTYYFPYKYKSASYNAPVTEYETVFRLAEQYLIRAEARIQLHDVPGGIDDLNFLRARARPEATTENPDPLPDLAKTLPEADALEAVKHERQVELFTEWGHRWFDLKRTGKVDAVMGADEVTTVKGSTWNTNAQYYPVPLSELQTNPKLVQNAGY